MSNDRASEALKRIDAALARIESAAISGDTRYARLRSAAQAAVGQLDTLIATGAR